MMMKRNRLTRRKFLGTPATCLAAKTTLGAQPKPFRGFIVSDAHFGWNSPVQPTVEESRRAMQKIMARFPDLDVFVDTGDAHHSWVEDVSRGHWTDIIAGGCGTAPFLYCVGNHELAGEEDTEARSCRLGSLACRPYQSWSLKGIHLVAAPQLIQMSYVCEELLEWLELDLSLHKDLTTLVFSHNSLRGTTKSGDDVGYRQIVNSTAVLDLLRRYPNVLAWMHGHNHTWELVPAFGKLFVSNGRIGGFDPGGPGTAGNGHIGGIYFEIGSDYLAVRGYSATRDGFFDEFDAPSRYMRQTLKTATTFNPSAPASVCYGMGRSRDGQRLPVYRHHGGARGRAEVFLTGVASPVFNENSGMGLFTQRFADRGRKPAEKLLAGYNIAPVLSKGRDPDESWEWMDPGIRLKALNDPSMRRSIMVPGDRAGRFRYYRCAPGMRLRVDIEASCERASPRLQLVCHVCDSNGKQKTAVNGPWWVLTQKSETRSHEFELPAPESGTIYREMASDTQIQAYVEAVIADLRSDVLVRRLELRFAGAEPGTLDAALSMGGRKTQATGRLAPGKIHRAEWDAPSGPRSVVQVDAGGNRLVTWLVRETQVQWQVRNAPAAVRDGWLEIGRLRNTFSPRQEVLIAPTAGDPAVYVHRLRNVHAVRIHPAVEGMRAVIIELRELAGTAELDLVCTRKPGRVEGADTWTFQDDRITISKSSPGTIRVEA